MKIRTRRKLTALESQALVRYTVQILFALGAYCFAAFKIDAWPGMAASWLLTALMWKIAWDGPKHQIEVLQEREMKQWLKTVT